jgi:hypothetical protein
MVGGYICARLTVNSEDVPSRTEFSIAYSDSSGVKQLITENETTSRRFVKKEKKKRTKKIDFHFIFHVLN